MRTFWGSFSGLMPLVSPNEEHQSTERHKNMMLSLN